MKTNLIVKTLMIAIMWAGASCWAGEKAGNGGGVVMGSDGLWTTFYSAGFYVNTIPEDVPQLSPLINFINQSAYLSDTTKVAFISALQATESRHYYKVKEDQFTPDVRARLIQAYVDAINSKLPAGATKLDPGQIAPAAVTDPSTGNTFLLPEFYALKTAPQQMAILYHEAFWMLRPTAAYSEVILTEMAFQNYLENQNVNALFTWLQSAKLGGDLWVAAINSDLNTGAMKKILDRQNRFPMNLIFNDAYENCRKIQSVESCHAILTRNILNLSTQYSNSLFLKLLSQKALNDKVFYDTTDRDIRNDLNEQWSGSHVQGANLILRDIATVASGSFVRIVSDMDRSDRLCLEIELN